MMDSEGATMEHDAAAAGPRSESFMRTCVTPCRAWRVRCSAKGVNTGPAANCVVRKKDAQLTGLGESDATRRGSDRRQKASVQ